MQEDVLCVKQTLDGDEQAFHRLIIKYYATIHALILSWVKNPEDAEDLMQEIFLRAYQELDSLRHPEQFRLWLRQIARHQCQNWLRKEKTFLQLDDDMICETPLADETLILQETLAKVMKAIDELPKSESQLLKERYLDDASYDEMETQHGLSHSVLAMRLFRAREKVRESVKKALAGIGILTFRYSAEDILTKGVVAVKITLKAKLITTIVATSVILGGTGVVLWYYQSTQETSEKTISQADQQTHLSSLTKNVTVNKAVTSKNTNKPIDKQKEDAKESQSIAQTDSLKESTGQETKVSETKVGGTVDPEEEYLLRRFGLTRAEIDAKLPVIEGEIKTEMFRIIGITNKILDVTQSGEELDPEKVKWINETQSEAMKAWLDLIDGKFDLYQKYKMVTDIKGLIADTSEGGWIYEMQKLLPPPEILSVRIGQAGTGRD